MSAAPVSSPTPQETYQSSGPRALIIAIVLAVLTFTFHLAFGLYYSTHAEGIADKPDLHARGIDFFQRYTGWDSAHEHDAAAYNRMALETLRTGWPRSRGGAISFYAPAYAFFLAGCYGLFGVQLIAVAAPQALLSGAIAFLIGLCAGRLPGRNPNAALLIGTFLILINLRLAMYVGSIIPVLLLGFCVALALAAAAGKESPINQWLLGLGLVLGSFSQAGFSIIALACGAWLLLRKARSNKWAGVVIVAMACVKLALSTVDLSGGRQDSLRETVNGGILWEANNPYYESMTLTSRWERRPGNQWSDWRISPAEQERFDSYLARAGGVGRSAAKLWIRENPGQYLKLCFVRLRTSIGPYTGMMSPRNRLISSVWWVLIVPAGVWGLWRWRSLPVTKLAIVLILTVLAMDTLVIVEWYLRYRLPSELALTAFAAAAYSELMKRLRG